MAEIAELQKQIANYSKTREVYAAYRKAGYSKKFLAAQETEILLHKAAKAAFDKLGLQKLPTMKTLQAEYADLLASKKKAYAEYAAAKKDRPSDSIGPSVFSAPARARSRSTCGAFARQRKRPLPGDWGQPPTSVLNSFRIAKNGQTRNGMYRCAMLAAIA